MANVLVLGASGYVGGRLVPRLIAQGHHVRCLARSPQKLAGREWSDQVEMFKGDTLDYQSLGPAMRDIDLVYYLVHSMSHGPEDFEDMEKRSAKNVARATIESEVERIIYLGGLGDRDEVQSAHLRSRHAVGDILRESSASVTEFRAAVIIGSGSLSFEMIHHLVNRLPMMICPKWVYSKTQPIAIRDVLAYLLAAVDTEEARDQIIDIGGPEILSYRELMLAVASHLRLNRYLLQVPVLTPTLSSYWINLVTPLGSKTARSLIESVRHDTVCENNKADELFDITPMSIREAIRRAFQREKEAAVESSWTDAETVINHDAVDASHLKSDTRSATADAPAEVSFQIVSEIGGKNGWYFGSWLWRVRGFVDQQLGGVGLRRGRRHPSKLAVGDALDFWRVEAFEPNRLLRLRAEMRVWGEAWLEYRVAPVDSHRSSVTQSATYYPRGLFGRFYWFAIYPFHMYVFAGLHREIIRRAEDRFTATIKQSPASVSDAQKQNT